MIIPSFSLIPLSLRTLFTASSASPSSSCIESGILLSELMTINTMGLFSHGMSSMLYRVIGILRASSPAEIVKPVVQWVRVGVVTGLLSRERKTIKSHKYQAMYSVLSPWFSWQRHPWSPIDYCRAKNLSLEIANSSIIVLYSSINRPNPAKIRNFISSFIFGNWKPLFISHNLNYTIWNALLELTMRGCCEQ